MSSLRHLRRLWLAPRSQGLARTLPRRLYTQSSATADSIDESNSNRLDEATEDLEQQKAELQWLEYAVHHSNRRGESKESVRESVRARRASGEPISYIIGHQPFGSLDLLTKPPVLIPRPETEQWSVEIARKVDREIQRRIKAGEPSSLRVLDLCCGSGCIGLQIAHHAKTLLFAKYKLYRQTFPPGTPDIEVILADISPLALSLAKENTNRNRLHMVDQPSFLGRALAARLVVTTQEVDVHLEDDRFHQVFPQSCDGNDGKGYDLIVCNPPYIPTSDYETLDPSVRDWEDRRALVGDVQQKDGLDFYRRILHLVETKTLLRRRTPETSTLPSLVFEVGQGQATVVEEMMQNVGKDGGKRRFAKTEVANDPWCIERTVTGWLE